MLAPLVWVHIVMYEPVLMHERPVEDVVSDVEELAGHMADLLAVSATQPTGAVAAANSVLDACCDFVERWSDRWSMGSPLRQSFAGDVYRLRLTLDSVAEHLAPADLDIARTAS